MASIDFMAFKGEMPLIDPKKLSHEMAVSARNCDLSSGSIEPIKGLGSAVQNILTSDSASLHIHPFTKDFRAFGEDVDLVRGPLANDQWERVYWTDGLYPKYSTSENTQSSYRLGLPAPSSAPTVSVDVSPEGVDGAFDIDCAYIVTYVSKYGEEGPPSDASSIVTRKDGKNVSITNLPGVLAGSYNVDRIRIYRTEGYETFNFVAELPVETSSYTDSTTSENLGSICPSINWYAPESSMKGLCHVGNGVFAGFFGNTLCLSEPYYPHAWPLDYQYAFPVEIVGISITASGLIVLTKSDPWVLAGSNPAGMYQQKIDSPLACIAKDSICDMGEYVLYASNDGLVAATGSEAKLISSNHIGSKDFKALQPELWQAYRVDDRYFAIGNSVCISFSPSEGFKYFDIDNIETGCVDSESGDLFVLLADQSVRKWNDGDDQIFTWRSGIITVPPRNVLTCGRLDADGAVNLAIYMDGVEVLSKEYQSNKMFRLPCTRFRELQVSISGTNTVHSLTLAQSPAELK